MTQAVAHHDHPSGRYVKPDLSGAMRDGSRDAHQTAEASPFVNRLISGRLEPVDYLAYLERLQAVYAVLEDVTSLRRDVAPLAAVYDERLLRSAALADDVRYWRRFVGIDVDAATELTGAAVAAYQARLWHVGAEPGLLVAHHYTRYLGDLSGGRILARKLADRFGRAGLSFYDFPLVPDPVAYKRGYRDRLDELVLTDDQGAAIVAEVRVAFDLNRALLDEIG